MPEKRDSLSREQELALSRAVVRGDREALDRFHGHLCDPLYRFVHYRLGGVTADVEEIVQETFLAALESLHRFRGSSALFTWCCAIAKHHIRRLRQRRSREQLAVVLEAMDSRIDSILTDLSREKLPQEILEAEETCDRVGAAMASLPLDYQAVLTDKYIESLSVKEIAIKQGKSSKAVESTLTRARIAFRRIFELLGKGMSGEVEHA